LWTGGFIPATSFASKLGTSTPCLKTNKLDFLSSQIRKKCQFFERRNFSGSDASCVPSWCRPPSVLGLQLLANLRAVTGWTSPPTPRNRFNQGLAFRYLLWAAGVPAATVAANARCRAKVRREAVPTDLYT
jgi:hypothetical protein